MGVLNDSLKAEIASLKAKNDCLEAGNKQLNAEIATLKKEIKESIANIRLSREMLESILNNPKQFTRLNTDKHRHLCTYLKVKEHL